MPQATLPFAVADDHQRAEGEAPAALTTLATRLIVTTFSRKLGLLAPPRL